MSRKGQGAIPKGIRDQLGLPPGDSLGSVDVRGRIVLASKRTRRSAGKFNQVMGEFDRVLRDVRLSEDEIVRLVRRGTALPVIRSPNAPPAIPGPAGGGAGGPGDSGGG